MPLNDAMLKAARKKDKPYRLGDSGQLYLYVPTTGARLWRMNYTVRDPAAGKLKQKTLSLGSYPDVSLVKARAARDAAKELLRQGIDPGVQRKVDLLTTVAANANTFEVVARRWHDKQKGRWSPVHCADVLRSLEEDVFPHIGALPISMIRAPKLLEMLTAIEDRGAIETAHRIRSRLSSVFVFGIASGICDADPAASLGKALMPKPRAKKQPAITALPALQQVLIDCEAQRTRASTKLALRLLALTAVRPGELQGARWAEIEGIDWATDAPAPEALWRIPAARMKGDKDRKAEEGGDHLVPLAPASVDVLRVLHRLSGDLVLVLPSERHPHRPISENTLRALLIRAGYHQRHVPHGFRAAFSTIMNERAKAAGLDGDRAVIDLMLAHVPGNKVEASYNRAAYMERRRELAGEWAEMLVGDFWPPEMHLGQPIRHGDTRPKGPRIREPAMLSF